MSGQEHWEAVYGRKAADQVSWYRPHLERSLRIIENAALPLDAEIIDVGGGASTLVDDLILRGYSNLTVLDISAAAIACAKTRLGGAADSVKWIAGDITLVDLPEHEYALWHDRAVFHFLRDPEQRRRYVTAARRALMPGGHIVVATFGPEGPERCSGLDVVRYSADGLHAEFGEQFRKVSSQTEIHTTPWGAEQEFVYCYCRLMP
jgi:SAM-dependent methyltransferase